MVIVHSVTAPELKSVGDEPGGAGFKPYWLSVVLRARLDEIQVLVALLPCRNEYGYHVPFVDW